MSVFLEVLLASHAIVALIAYFWGYSQGQNSRQDEIDRLNDQLDATTQELDDSSGY